MLQHAKNIIPIGIQKVKQFPAIFIVWEPQGQTNEHPYARHLDCYNFDHETACRRQLIIHTDL